MTTLLVTKEDQLEFYKAEATYWHREAERLRGILRSVGQAIRDTHAQQPPEPPVGTQFFVDGEIAWTRAVDGWVCPRLGCRNCPTEWCEIHELIDNSVEHITRILPQSGSNAAATP